MNATHMLMTLRRSLESIFVFIVKCVRSFDSSEMRYHPYAAAIQKKSCKNDIGRDDGRKKCTINHHILCL